MQVKSADWLVWKFLSSTIHLQATKDTRVSRVQFLTTFQYINGNKHDLLVSLWYILKQLFHSVSVKMVDSHLIASFTTVKKIVLNSKKGFCDSITYQLETTALCP